MARTPLVVGNWKLHFGVNEALALATEVKNALGALRDVEIGVAPVFTALHAVGKRLEGSPVRLCAQDCFWEDKGAWTGEVSAPLLADCGVRYVIVGHSERRQLLGEGDAAVGKKANAVVRGGLWAILCVGETERERDAGETMGVIGRQLDKGLALISRQEAERLVIAYEPVWAIGTGRTATPSQAQEVHAYVRGELRQRWGDHGDAIRIQYGGSVKPENAAELMAQPDIDGALVGGASLEAAKFIAICRAAAARGR